MTFLNWNRRFWIGKSCCSTQDLTQGLMQPSLEQAGTFRCTLMEDCGSNNSAYPFFGWKLTSAPYWSQKDKIEMVYVCKNLNYCFRTTKIPPKAGNKFTHTCTHRHVLPGNIPCPGDLLMWEFTLQKYMTHCGGLHLLLGTPGPATPVQSPSPSATPNHGSLFGRPQTHAPPWQQCQTHPPPVLMPLVLHTTLIIKIMILLITKKNNENNK